MLRHQCGFKTSFYLPPPAELQPLASEDFPAYTTDTGAWSGTAATAGLSQLYWLRCSYQAYLFTFTLSHKAWEIERWEREHPSQSCFKGSLSNDFSFQDVTQKNNLLCLFPPPVPIQKPTKCVCWLLLHRLPRATPGERRRARKTLGALQTKRRAEPSAVMTGRWETYELLSHHQHPLCFYGNTALIIYTLVRCKDADVCFSFGLS